MDDLLVIARANYDTLLHDDDVWVHKVVAGIKAKNPLWYSDLWIGRHKRKSV